MLREDDVLVDLDTNAKFSEGVCCLATEVGRDWLDGPPVEDGFGAREVGDANLARTEQHGTRGLVDLVDVDGERLGELGEITEEGDCQYLEGRRGREVTHSNEKFSFHRGDVVPFLHDVLARTSPSSSTSQKI